MCLNIHQKKFSIARNTMQNIIHEKKKYCKKMRVCVNYKLKTTISILL